MRTGKRFVPGLVIGLSMFVCLAGALAATPDPRFAYSILHNFAGGESDGFQPFGSLTLSGFTLYGMTSGGLKPPGSNNSYCGTVFKINPDGTGYQILHSFELPENRTDGATPKGSLTLSGSTLYGFTTDGSGPPAWHLGGGTVFKINTDGTGYQDLYGFDVNTAGVPLYPAGTPVISGSIIYGMASGYYGGNGNGGVFQINTDGTGWKLLHAFGGPPSDGANPFGSLTLVGSKLYGMTRWGGSLGGSGGYGVIFSIDLDTSEYKVLHNFAGHPNDGNFPQGSLTLVGSKLYGMTAAGGADGGVIFSINLDGNGYQILFDFSKANINNPYLLNGPLGSLTFSGAKLYGMAHGGGHYTGGGVFQINLDGTGFRPLHYSNSFPGDGAGPWDDVTLVGSRLYGMTYGGGTSSDGVIFSCQTPQSDAAIMQLLLLN